MSRREQLTRQAPAPDYLDTGRDYYQPHHQEAPMSSSTPDQSYRLPPNPADVEQNARVARQITDQILEAALTAPDWSQDTIALLVPTHRSDTGAELTADERQATLEVLTYELLGIVSDLAEDIRANEVRDIGRDAIRRAQR